MTNNITVVMTTYNGEKYILDQLDSIKKQTRRPDEVLIADDGSTDNTRQLVSTYISVNHLSGWRLIENSDNKGWRRNFIETAGLAGGDLIFFSDQDDIWIEDKLEIMEKEMDKHPEISVLAGEYIKFKDALPAYSLPENIRIKQVSRDKKILKTSLPGCVYCVRKNFFTDASEHWNGLFSHDALCWATSKMLGQLYVINRPVILWRRHGESTYTVTGKKMKSKDERIKYVKTQIENCRCLKRIVKEMADDSSYDRSINNYEIFLCRRLKMLEKRKIKDIFWLALHTQYYNKRKQFILELYLSGK